MISKAANRVLNVDMVLTVLPALREAIEATARDVAREDLIDEKDPFFEDEIAGLIIHKLSNFLTQSEIIVEDNSPLIHIRQMKPRYVRAWFGVQKPK